jgi:hypothetical protein
MISIFFIFEFYNSTFVVVVVVVVVVEIYSILLSKVL